MPYMPRYVLLTGLILLIVGSVQGQELRFDHITIDDGLSHSTVYAIAKDRDGFMWFGTRDGLNRYDGYEIRTYKSGGPESLGLKNHNIRSLLVQDNGDIWIGHAVGGLSILDDQTQTFRTPEWIDPDNLDWSSLSIFSMWRDRYGDTWLGTSYGVLHVRGDTVNHFVPGQKGPFGTLGSNECFSFAEDPKGNIWLGT
ncbi:MAG: two-component regulator propeller domain-containing protein, partial [Saprospiraceae bacterium]|nr:two-component regulator propeller domain-containing protein [Saprospiraceae bacterium]